MSEWQNVALKQLVKFGNGKSRPKEKGKIPVYGGNGILDFTDKYNYVGNTLIIGRVGAYCGATYLEKSPVWVSDNALSAKALGNNDSDYLYYLFKYLDLNQYAQGSSHPLLTQTLLNAVEVETTLDGIEQKAIASVLSSLDNKIDLLHRQNKTLEAMAETLFRQWFVEDAQDDWEEVTLSDVCHRITDGAHASPKSIENGWAMASVKDMETWGINYDTCRRISKEDYDELVRADCKALKGDILIAKDGSYLKHVFLLEKDIDVVLLSSIAMLRPNGKYDPMLLTIFLKMNSTREEMENIVTGAVIPRIVLKDFRKFPIRLPPKEYQTKALIQISPIFRKCWLNNFQIKKLENLRDTLLPKLMSGEVRVNYTPEEIKQ
uniref:restriction endonuclease subunit S n=1 Tax=Providencia sp. PROV265 TaxID=2949953 RepID=UPI00234B9F26|nr:restriction endonuclease subunit S [Providencia sp. PROV265]